MSGDRPLTDTHSLLKIVGKDFDLTESLNEEQLRAGLIKAFEYLMETDFPKLLQILYKADVDQYKLKELLANTENLSPAEVIANAYLDRQKAKIETWKKYS